MFDTTDQILNQLRAEDDGLAQFKALRLDDRGVLSPNTADLAGELFAFANPAARAVFLRVDDSGRRPEYALFGDELRLTLWAKNRSSTD